MTPEITSEEPIWTPDPATAARSQIAMFAAWAAEEYGAPADPLDYPALWAWSVAEPETFWAALLRWFGPPADGEAYPVTQGSGMVGAGGDLHWFPALRLNYVEQALRQGELDPGGIALIGCTEDRPDAEITWAELRRQVGARAATLSTVGVRSGDRVAGYLPNIPEAVVAFLATASLGAIWSGIGQDYAAPAAVDRFAQLEPVVLVTADGYAYAGKRHDRRDAVADLRAGLPTVRAVVAADRLGLDVPDSTPWAEATAGQAEPLPVRVPFDHPLWVLFSSGTTGLPKGIVHGHGGVLLEHLKTTGLQLDLGPGSRFLWYTSPSWMMWNYLISGLLVGATVVCYDGNPLADDADRLWQLAERHRVQVLGVSPAFLQAAARAGRDPGTEHDLAALRVLGSTGSVLAPSSYDWVRDHVGAGVQLVSTTGGTDVVTGFAGGAPTTPVYRGEVSARCLGVSLEAWDPTGQPVLDDVGELVITRPMPSMPVSFWNDPDGERYRAAYFDTFPGVWRHGDWVTVTGRGSIVVHGRSDSTLNRSGIRMGSADIYAVVERNPAVEEALVIGAELAGGGYWMPLFVVLSPGHELDDDLVSELSSVLRSELSPRHVPDEIIAVSGIPHTRTGKKLEIPVKRVLQGTPLERVAQPGAIDDVELLRQFEKYARRGA